MKLFFAVLLLICLFAPSFQQANRGARAAEELAKRVPEQTKRMVHAMAAQGMPKKAIADRILYSAGGNAAHAERLVDAIKAEGMRQKASKKR